MKVFISLIFILIVQIAYSQDNINQRIAQVENGLTFQATLPAGQKITTASITKQMEAYQINGLSVAVIRNGQLDWSKAYGLADKEQGTPVTTSTLFQCASIGKIVTALAALSLVKNNKLELDEDVNNKLKRWKIQENEYTQNQKVTLRHLLSHSAGFKDEYGFVGYTPKDKLPNIVQILNNESPANAKKSMQVQRLPGSVEQYSGGGYLIIQLLIEDITGESFADYVQKTIFDPLEMKHATYAYRPDIELEKPIASGHHSNGKNLKKKKYHLYPEKAAAGFWTTAEDLAKLIIEIQKEYNRQSALILDYALIQEMMSPQINNKALGVNIKGLKKPEAFWHAGNNLGYTALFYGLLEQGGGAVILSNSDGGEKIIQEFITSIAHTYTWPVMQSVESLEVSQSIIDASLGTYQDEKGRVLIIGENEQGLYLQVQGQKAKNQLYRINRKTYTVLAAQDYLSIEFMEEGKKASGLILNQSIGKTSQFKKND